MAGKISGFLREYILILSIVITIVGFFLLVMGVLWYWVRGIVTDNNVLSFIYDLGDWNAYVLVAGFIIFFIGVYYLYSFFKNRKFVLEELRTNKRSELLKRHKELRSVVKHLPKKYQKMLQEKEDELNI